MPGVELAEECASCGHSESHHYAVSGRCMKIVKETTPGEIFNNQCGCKKFRKPSKRI